MKSNTIGHIEPTEFLVGFVTRQELGWSGSALGWPAVCGSLDFMKQRFHMSPGDYERALIKAGTMKQGRA